MSTHQEKPNETVTPVPDITLVSDSEDEEVVDLEAVSRAAKAKLEEDLAKAKTRNVEIAWKKQAQVDHLAKKKKEDKEAAEVQWNVDEAAKKKVLVPPPVSSALPVFLGLETNMVSRLGQLFRPRTRRQGRPSVR